MNRRTRLPIACLLLVAGACTCFEQKRSGPLPTALQPPTPEERAERRQNARPPPTPLDPSPTPLPVPPPPPITAVTPAAMPVAGAPMTAPMPVAAPPEPPPVKVAEPAPEDMAPPHATIERLNPLGPRKGIESLRSLAPGQRAQLLRSPMLTPRKLQKGPEPAPAPEE